MKVHALIPLLFAFVIHDPLMAAAQPYEPPGSLQTSEILPDAILESDLYQVADEAANDGLINTYQIASDFGDFEATSTIGLYKLIGEIKALDKMRKVEQSDSYKKALEDSSVDLAGGVKHLALHPVNSVTGAGKGVATLFYRAEESMFGSSPGETEDSRTKQLIGFSKSKRHIAKSFEVDAYSTNSVLQEGLNKLAWADYAGGMTLSVASLPLVVRHRSLIPPRVRCNF